MRSNAVGFDAAPRERTWRFVTRVTDPDADLNDLETADAAADIAHFVAECQRSREATAGLSLDEVVPSRGHHPERTRNVRWIYLHMIEEYARHNGHADLLRERIDGATGD